MVSADDRKPGSEVNFESMTDQSNTEVNEVRSKIWNPSDSATASSNKLAAKIHADPKTFKIRPLTNLDGNNKI